MFSGQDGCKRHGQSALFVAPVAPFSWVLVEHRSVYCWKNYSFPVEITGSK